jgi:uncharacterized protein YjbI with pentapeptide repeats
MMLLRKLWKQRFFNLAIVAIAIIVGIVVVVLLIQLGYHADWTGFNRHVDRIPSGEQDQPAKTLWDWLQLLIIPFVLAVGGFMLNFTMSRTEQKIAAQRYENDQAIALDKQREDLLQTYLDRMSDLLLEKDLRASPPEAEVRNVARVRTLTILGQLDTPRKNAVLSFLREAKLVTSEPGKSIVSLSQAKMANANLKKVDFASIDLSRANLIFANLSRANLSRANLSGANLIKADLSEADLSEADLSEAELSRANLSRANLSGADLSEADFWGADLSGANLSEANLSGADLSEANLSGADLSEADLSEADLSEANLSGANLDTVIGITQEQLAQAKATDAQSPSLL